MPHAMGMSIFLLLIFCLPIDAKVVCICEPEPCHPPCEGDACYRREQRIIGQLVKREAGCADMQCKEEQKDSKVVSCLVCHTDYCNKRETTEGPRHGLPKNSSKLRYTFIWLLIPLGLILFF
ncbi:unnamed protein product, partial [Mesorhabditis spiculigera]